jgi:hypothetical protein
MDILPKKLASYIHETGLRALDHLAQSDAGAPESTAPDALQALLGQWRSMSAEQKDDFVTKVSASVGEVIAASALLPIGIKVGKKAMKSAKKVLKKSAKTLKKNAKAAKKNQKAAKKSAKKSAKKAPRTVTKKAAATRKTATRARRKSKGKKST